MKTENRRDANFLVTGDTGVFIKTNSGATSNDKIWHNDS